MQKAVDDLYNLLENPIFTLILITVDILKFYADFIVHKANLLLKFTRTSGRIRFAKHLGVDLRVLVYKAIGLFVQALPGCLIFSGVHKLP